jgi:4-phospho-D-threonate 3-dehydrogenase / 4-phospho-D-erythronate 3-dehydrogenase
MKTRILLTIGDFNGIGPEIIIKLISNPRFTEKYELTVLSPITVMEFYSKLFKIKLFPGNFNVIPVGNEKIKVQPGKISDQAGFISGLAVVKAVDMCMNGEYDAIVTAPLSKEALNIGGFNFSGHTGMLREFGKAEDVCMMMVSPKLTVALATTHPPLNMVPKLLNVKLLHSRLNICYRSLKNDFAVEHPRIGVLGLNPHAGDGGVIGKEELKVISPAIKQLNKGRGLAFSGPFPADAYFASGAYKKYNAAFAMYHDQGLIPFKMIAGMNGINYTAGLSFVRTSPDHGTAFDIAGKNKAIEKSMAEAVKMADKIFKNRIKT